jgi:hypothetical protein
VMTGAGTQSWNVAWKARMPTGASRHRKRTRSSVRGIVAGALILYCTGAARYRRARERSYMNRVRTARSARHAARQ